MKNHDAGVDDRTKAGMLHSSPSDSRKFLSDDHSDARGVIPPNLSLPPAKYRVISHQGMEANFL